MLSGEKFNLEPQKLRLLKMMVIRINTDKPDGNREVARLNQNNNLGWKHKTGLDDGLEKTIKWFNENLSVVLPGRH